MLHLLQIWPINHSPVVLPMDAQQAFLLFLAFTNKKTSTQNELPSVAHLAMLHILCYSKHGSFHCFLLFASLSSLLFAESQLLYKFRLRAYTNCKNERCLQAKKDVFACIQGFVLILLHVFTCTSQPNAWEQQICSFWHGMCHRLLVLSSIAGFIKLFMSNKIKKKKRSVGGDQSHRLEWKWKH